MCIYLYLPKYKCTVHSESLILVQVDCSVGGMWFHFPFFKATPRFAFPLSPVPPPCPDCLPEAPLLTINSFYLRNAVCVSGTQWDYGTVRRQVCGCQGYLHVMASLDV